MSDVDLVTTPPLRDRGASEGSSDSDVRYRELKAKPAISFASITQVDS